MTTGRNRLDQIVRGLDGVTAGPWTTWPNSPWAVREDTHNGWQILAPLHRSKDEVVRNAEHIARCSPDAIREIAAYVRETESRATAAEATVTALQEALEKIARGTSLVFTSNPQTMNGREAIDIARATLSQIRSEK